MHFSYVAIKGAGILYTPDKKILQPANISLGKSPASQAFSSLLSPMQSFPPPEGAGLVQKRCLIL